ncbi:hypothetical protein IWQ62_002189 [Dispira parvispora]|uniref:GRAM domain-containing protein n=1 Tax=Dispira parvispora TaxID=1520584 RepID=A0A9W8AQW4_9FUNG|nr:hypothetical protein IWQ62_002189 [Dispira parvispora]
MSSDPSGGEIATRIVKRRSLLGRLRRTSRTDEPTADTPKTQPKPSYTKDTAPGSALPETICRNSISQATRPFRRHKQNSAQKCNRRQRRFRRSFPALDPATVSSLQHNFKCSLDFDVFWKGRLFVTPDGLYFYGRRLNPFVRLNHAALSQLSLADPATLPLRYPTAVHISLPFRSITGIHKDSLLGIFPNVIRIQTPGQNFILAGFFARDTAYQALLEARQKFHQISGQPISTTSGIISRVENDHGGRSIVFSHFQRPTDDGDVETPLSSGTVSDTNSVSTSDLSEQATRGRALSHSDDTHIASNSTSLFGRLSRLGRPLFSRRRSITTSPAIFQSPYSSPSLVHSTSRSSSSRPQEPRLSLNTGVPDRDENSVPSSGLCSVSPNENPSASHISSRQVPPQSPQPKDHSLLSPGSHTRTHHSTSNNPRRKKSKRQTRQGRRPRSTRSLSLIPSTPRTPANQTVTNEALVDYPTVDSACGGMTSTDFPPHTLHHTLPSAKLSSNGIPSQLSRPASYRQTESLFPTGSNVPSQTPLSSKAGGSDVPLPSSFGLHTVSNALLEIKHSLGGLPLDSVYNMVKNAPSFLTKPFTNTQADEKRDASTSTSDLTSINHYFSQATSPTLPPPSEVDALLPVSGTKPTDDTHSSPLLGQKLHTHFVTSNSTLADTTAEFGLHTKAQEDFSVLNSASSYPHYNAPDYAPSKPTGYLYPIQSSSQLYEQMLVRDPIIHNRKLRNRYPTRCWSLPPADVERWIQHQAEMEASMRSQQFRTTLGQSSQPGSHSFPELRQPAAQPLESPVMEMHPLTARVALRPIRGHLEDRRRASCSFFTSTDLCPSYEKRDADYGLIGDGRHRTELASDSLVKSLRGDTSPVNYSCTSPPPGWRDWCASGNRGLALASCVAAMWMSYEWLKITSQLGP